MIQGRKNIFDSTFSLYNTQLNNQLEINYSAAKLLRTAYAADNLDELRDDIKTREFFDTLQKFGFFVESDSSIASARHVFLGRPIHYRYPLSSLSIELTNGCNLRCKHCYGDFHQTAKFQYVPLDWIRKSIDDLNSLHVRNIGLTGGESTIHPDFLDIVTLFLENGFEVCVFTNGYNYKIIKDLLSRTSQYHFMMKVSLDGTEEVHNAIRGNDNAYSNALKTLDIISTYSNVNLYVSSVVMRQNIADINKLDNLVRMRYPNAIHTKDLAFPMGNSDDFAFSLDELPAVEHAVPSLLLSSEADKLSNGKSKKSKLPRCSGGISQCTLMPDGSLKICNSACSRQFYFEHNAYTNGLKYAWINCGKKISEFRREKAKCTYQCKKCLYVNECERNDCRVLAWVYTGDARNSNPLTCYMQKRMRETKNEAYN